MWLNRKVYNGLSVLPHNGGTYKQAPFQDCTEEEYNALIPSLKNVDLSLVNEEEDNTDLQGEIACGSAGCEIF